MLVLGGMKFMSNEESNDAAANDELDGAEPVGMVSDLAALEKAEDDSTGVRPIRRSHQSPLHFDLHLVIKMLNLSLYN